MPSLVTAQPPTQVAHFPEGCEILHHGALRRSRVKATEVPFYVRFHHGGQFIPFLTDSSHFRQDGGNCLVRIYAVGIEDALATLEYHYGSAIRRDQPVSFEMREPVRVVRHHGHSFVIWPPQAA